MTETPQAATQAEPTPKAGFKCSNCGGDMCRSGLSTNFAPARVCLNCGHTTVVVARKRSAAAVAKRDALEKTLRSIIGGGA